MNYCDQHLNCNAIDHSKCKNYEKCTEECGPREDTHECTECAHNSLGKCFFYVDTNTEREATP